MGQSRFKIFEHVKNIIYIKDLTQSLADTIAVSKCSQLLSLLVVIHTNLET